MKKKKVLTVTEFASIGGVSRWAGKTKKERRAYMEWIRTKKPKKVIHKQALTQASK